MIARYEINFDDLMALQRDGIKNSKLHKKNKMTGRIVGFVAAFFIYYILMDETLLRSIVYGIIFLFIAPIVYTIIATFKFESDLKKTNSSSFVEDLILTVSEDELCIEKGNSKKIYYWKDIIRISSDNNRYFLYFDDQNAIIIKKFPYNINDNERVEFNAFINKILNSNSLLH